MMATDFWQNLQFDLVLAAALVVVGVGAGAAARPRRRPALSAGRRVPGHLLALSPLLALSDGAGAAARQVAVRGAHGGRADHRLDVVLICDLALQAAPPSCAAFVVAAARRPASSRFLGFALLMLLAVPAVRPLPHPELGRLSRCHARQRAQPCRRDRRSRTRRWPAAPYDLLVENWVLTSQSLLLRAKRGDGVSRRRGTSPTGAVPAAGAAVTSRPVLLARLSVRAMRQVAAYRGRRPAAVGAWPPEPP